MKFQPDIASGVNTISRHEGGALWVQADRHGSSVLVPWRGAVRPWAVQSPAALTEAHFAELLGLEPEVVIFGSGTRLCFVRAALMRHLIERRIGVETMDTPAACRTFNVLASEGRCVVAALILEAIPA